MICADRGEKMTNTTETSYSTYEGMRRRKGKQMGSEFVWSWGEQGKRINWQLQGKLCGERVVQTIVENLTRMFRD